MISVEAVGVLRGSHSAESAGPAGARLLPVASRRRGGQPDECRVISPSLDEVSPGSQEEWGFWLDPAQGMIGWPQFQTKDGKRYERVWAPGGTRIPPRELTETVQDLRGTTSRKIMAMLYAAPTGAAPPAPVTNTSWSATVDEGGQAWVDIHAGIDINPAALTLPSVAL